MYAKNDKIRAVMEEEMVFVSYKSEEYEIARRIRELLEQHNYPCWMAPESIPAGSNYMLEIPKAIRKCDLFILIISEASQKSQWVQKEIDRAVKFDKYILPFQVDNSELSDAIDFVVSNNQRIQAYQNFEPACQELLRAVKQRHPAVKESAVPTITTPTKLPVKQEVLKGGVNIVPLLKRVFMFLEDEDWNNADAYCEKILDLDPENGQAYMGKLMVDLRIKRPEHLMKLEKPFDKNRYYVKAIRYADEETKKQLTEYIAHIQTRNENNRLEKLYARAKLAFQSADTVDELQEAGRLFDAIAQYADAAAMAKQCRDAAEQMRVEFVNKYEQAMALSKSADSEAGYLQAARIFESIPNYKDAATLAKQCNANAKTLQQQLIERKYEAAKETFEKAVLDTDYMDAAHLFESLSSFRDSVSYAQRCYNKAEAVRKANLERKKQLDATYDEAAAILKTAQTEKDYWKAGFLFGKIKSYKDADSLREQCLMQAEAIKKDAVLQNAKEKMDLRSYTGYCEAIDLCNTISGWRDADECVDRCRNLIQIMLDERERKRKRKKRILIAVLVACVLLAIAAVLYQYYI